MFGRGEKPAFLGDSSVPEVLHSAFHIILRKLHVSGSRADRAWRRANSFNVSSPTDLGSMIIKNKTGVGGTW